MKWLWNHLLIIYTLIVSRKGNYSHNLSNEERLTENQNDDQTKVFVFQSEICICNLKAYFGSFCYVWFNLDCQIINSLAGNTKHLAQLDKPALISISIATIGIGEKKFHKKLFVLIRDLIETFWSAATFPASVIIFRVCWHNSSNPTNNIFCGISFQ